MSRYLKKGKNGNKCFMGALMEEEIRKILTVSAKETKGHNYFGCHYI